jgi:hypothetical protein
MTFEGGNETAMDGLRSTICRFVACMDEQELRELDVYVMSVVQARHDWARYPGDRWWHAVLEWKGASVVTECNGRWPTRDEYQIRARPPIAERCSYCQTQYVERRKTEIAQGLP